MLPGHFTHDSLMVNIQLVYLTNSAMSGLLQAFLCATKKEKVLPVSRHVIYYEMVLDLRYEMGSLEWMISDR